MNQTPAGEPVDPQHQRDAKRCGNATLRTSRFDRVSSFLTALMLFLGTLVLLLAVVWMWSDTSSKDGRPLRPEFEWGTVNFKGFERDFLEPGVEETVELNEPNMRDSVLAVTDAVSHVAPSVQASLVNQLVEQGHNRLGDPRQPGPDADNDISPRFERWQLDFVANDVDSYARQLDHYQIELGLIGGGIQGLDYAANLSNQPNMRHGDSGSEKRLYFMWSRVSPLIRFDRQLLQRAYAHAATADAVTADAVTADAVTADAVTARAERREILKFIPPELENQLAKIELEYAMARGRSLNSIAKTVFISKSDGDGYQFVVSQQRYRKQKD